MSQPGRYDLAVYRGDTHRWRFTFWSDDAHLVPVDLTGTEQKAEIRAAPGAVPIVALSLTLSAPNIVDAVLPAATSALTVSGVWDLQVTTPGGDVRTYIAGKVTVTPDVTDSLSGLAVRARAETVPA